MAKVEESRRLQLAASAGWSFTMSPATQRRWLGPEGALPPSVGATVVIPWAVGVWRSGIIESFENDRVIFSLRPPGEWQARHGSTTRVTVSVSADPKDDAAVVTIAETGFEDLDGASDPAAAEAEASRRWSKALDDLEEAARAARRKSNAVRQVVLVIHGIGEQTPGDTVRKLVQAAAEPTERDSVRSKPDRISHTFELRSWTLDRSQIRPPTDFFEVYWADKVRDTTISQVWAWIRRLLLRSPGKVPRSLKPVWWTLWLALAFTAFLVLSLLPSVDVGRYAQLLSFIGAVVLGVISGFMVNSLGDAARYLWPHPANIAVRDRIRTAGVNLLSALHASGRYHRIIVVGHSLGSVIAHDIVSEYWIATRKLHDAPIVVSNKEAAALVGLLETNSPRPDDATKGSPWSVWCEMRRNTQPWLITDLITAGSPLAHASLLLAGSKDELEGMFERRELAACPPRPLDDVWYDDDYTDQLGRPRTFRYFTHNAPFAAVRWTNLYFPVRFGFFGDVVGGPLVEVFGPWVNDQALRWQADRWRGHTLLAHTLYWKLPKSVGQGSWAHLDVLRTALDLDRRTDLEALAREMPRQAWISPMGAGS